MFVRRSELRIGTLLDGCNLSLCDVEHSVPAGCDDG